MNRSELPVAVVGGGFSGSLLTINLLRNGEKVVLIERESERLARGIAFGTRRPEHLLNVRASNMSAFPDDAGHFLRWMGFSTTDEANRFVPRLAYGQYLREALVDALAAAAGRGEVIEREATAARIEPDHAVVTLSGGRELACRALVLALGNFPPSAYPPLADLPPDVHFNNPWTSGAQDNLDGISQVVLLGSGLTAIDVVMSMERAGYTGAYIALSRRGLKPRSHAHSGPAVMPGSAPLDSGSALLHSVRKRAEEIGWRAAVDELRPHTQHLWRRHDTAAQRRFLRHLRPYWDVHRHRVAPAVAEHIAKLEESGRLQFLAGKLLRAERYGNGASLHWRPRGGDGEQTLFAERVINCIGPEGDITRTRDPLVRSLLADGHLRPDVHRLGIDVAQSGRVRDSSGTMSNVVFAVGPMTKGEAWEIVAVPDIRRQVWHLARYIADAHWVGGEGL